MNGLAEFLPGQGVGRLRVQQMISRRPEPKYEVKCDLCNSLQVVTHTQLRNESARCKFSGCGKSTTKRSRDLFADERQRLATREAERLAEEREVSERRMSAEADGWERPLSLAEQQAKIFRERRDQEERERIEAAQRAAEAPRLEAEREAAEEREKQEAAQRERDEKQRRYWAEWVQSDNDTKLFVTDAMRTAKMTKAEAEQFTAKAAEQFAASPEYAPFRTPENADAILGYLQRNGIRIADVETIRGAFVRLRDLGLLKAKPAPAPQPVQQPQRVNLSVAPESKAPPQPQPIVYHGWDLATGEPRVYSEREIERMSSEQMARALQMRVRGELELPRIGPGPVTRKQRGEA
jgi:hypothetical protein